MRRETGYCEACIAEALAIECGGVSLFESDQGFVYLTVWTSPDEYATALEQAESDDAEHEA